MSPDNKKNKQYQIDHLALEMLVCPLTKTRLSINKDKSELISGAGRVAFPIIDGVPLLCLNEARSLTQEEIDNLK